MLHQNSPVLHTSTYCCLVGRRDHCNHYHMLLFQDASNDGEHLVNGRCRFLNITLHMYTVRDHSPFNISQLSHAAHELLLA